MCKNKILKKLLAIILIFTLTFTNFAFTTKAAATTIAETLFGNSESTGHENVEFEAYFGTEEEKETSVISDVNNANLSINMDLNVKDKGYLKDAKIEILKSEEEKELNFELKSFSYIDEITGQENFNYPEYVQDITDNVVSLQQVNADNDLNINLPIEYKNETYVNENKLSSTATVKITGVYVDNKGEEHDISKSIDLTVNWKDEREVKVETNSTKYINFDRGVIIQTLIKVDTSTTQNTLPIRQSQLIVTAPEYQGNKPSNIKVVANSTVGTNGQTAENVSFNEDNWNYDEESNLITIHVDNNKQKVEINKYEDEFLKDESEVVSEERYYNIPGADEYLITYTYDNVVASNEEITLNSNIDAKVITLSGDVNNDNLYLTENNNTYEYLLNSLTDDIVSLNIENGTENVSKAYLYANYNKENYEEEISSNEIVNISYKDLVNKIEISDQDSLYIDKEGNEIANNDIYYKSISISKDVFSAILGNEGIINIYDMDENVIASINNESQVNENGMIVLNLDNQIRKVNIVTSKPIAEGNLVINKVKAIKTSTLSKEELVNIASMKTISSLNVEYEYVTSAVNAANVNNNITLNDTTTKATLSMDRESLSTLATNENVEIRVKLNNATDKSDLYGNSVYEISLPEYVESVDITNVNLIYGEGLNIASATLTDKTIRVEISGVQEAINSGVLTDGANIVINANIKVNLFAPAKTDKITLSYSNSQATSYVDNGYEELLVNYSAPSGLVAVNTLSNYDSVGSQITSVRQGEQEAVIDAYSDAKQSTMEIVVMNNNGNQVSNLSILGRIPSKGVKDLTSGEDLGTNVDTKLVSGIVSDERNNAAFTIYYSENLNATKDLDNEENGWVSNPESLDNMKSYLIVPVDSNYVMEDTQVLRFTYVYEIPGSLEKNANIYGTFLAYYTNNSETGNTDKTSAPDKVGLTTGKGPVITLNLETDSTKVRDYENYFVDLIIKNTGEEVANNVYSEYNLASNSSFVSSEVITNNAVTNYENGKLIIKADSLDVDSTIKVRITLRAEAEKQLEYDESEKDIDESYSVPDDQENTVEAVNEKENENVTTYSFATATCTDLGTTLEAKTNEIGIESADLIVSEELLPCIEEDEKDIIEIGREINYVATIKNISGKDLTNVVIEKIIPEEFTFSYAYLSTDTSTMLNNYDENTRTFSYTLESLPKNKAIAVNFVVKFASLDASVTSKDITSTTQARADGTEVYVSNMTKFVGARPVLEITQTSDKSDTYIKEGDVVNYTFTIKNTGIIGCTNLELKDVVGPEIENSGLKIQRIAYVTNNVPVSKYISSNDKAVLKTNIAPNSELTVNVQAIAQSLVGAQEKTVTNAAVIKADNVEEITTGSITHIIEPNENYASNTESTVEEVKTNTYSSSQDSSSKTYKLTGLAFVDANGDGAKNDGEEIVSGVSVKLVNSATGVIVKSSSTDSLGNYSFAGIENGTYLVVFDYDTVKYTVTAYQKEGVAANVNSDAVTTQIEQNGKKRNAAVTDKIEIQNGSKSNIDIGLVYADTFDLQLDTVITSVTVQNSQGTNKTPYEEGKKMAKTEIGSKYVTGSVVYVEYTFTVSNVGDVSGYAKNIVDYIPEGMTFNSNLNKDWYTGTDGNLYYTGLADTLLAKGQTTTFTLVLSQQMTESNTGLVNNVAEIYEDYNIYGISDTNSTPGNKAQGENDMSSADLYIGVKTGETLVYISVIITSILLGSVVIFVAYTKIFIVRRKRGV